MSRLKGLQRLLKSVEKEKDRLKGHATKEQMIATAKAEKYLLNEIERLKAEENVH